MANTSRKRFDLLASLFYAAPLPKAEFDELIQLAEKFNPKMAKYLKANYDSLV